MTAFTPAFGAQITWRHVRRGGGIGCRRKLPAEAITVCVIHITDRTSQGLAATVTDIAVCVHGDQFARLTGRWNSLHACLKQTFFKRQPDRIHLAEEIVRAYRELNPKKERPVRGAMDPLVRARMINDGSAKRAERKLGVTRDV